jgi:hypothetical protein
VIVLRLDSKGRRDSKGIKEAKELLVYRERPGQLAQLDRRDMRD